MQQVYSPYGQYKQQRNQVIESADPVTLISMLLEGALRYNKKALASLECKDEKSALEHITCAVDIVMHLYASLNFEQGGEIAERLGKLYNYICDQYIVFQRDMTNIKGINSIDTVLNTILEGWKKIPK